MPKTMYIAANTCKERGVYLGDVLTMIKTAWLFVENEPHDKYVLSLMEDDVFNFLWYRFIAVNNVKVVYDNWQKNNNITWLNYDIRLHEKKVTGIPFDTYKELYPRLEGGNRQSRLCGKEIGLGASNIFKYFYVGQPVSAENPINTENFDENIVYFKHWNYKNNTVFVAPEEKCQGNRIFTIDFWVSIIKKLDSLGVKVHINSNKQPFKLLENDNVKCVFPSYPKLFETLNQYSVVLCGNTGIGWCASATATPMIAFERTGQMTFAEYSFTSCGCKSLVTKIEDPKVDLAVAQTLSILNKGW